MKPNFQFDIGTLLAAEMLICMIFALVLLFVASHFRQVRGILQIAFGFLASFAALFLLMLRNSMPLALNVVLNNGLLFGANLLLYSGMGGLLGFRPRYRLPISGAIAAGLGLVYFTVADNDIRARIVLIALAECILKWNLIVDLLRHRGSSLIVRLLTACLLLWAVANLLRAAAAVFSGSSSNIFQHNFVQAGFVAIGIFSSCSMGIFCMALVGREVNGSIERSARRDPLTGALNRRGIQEQVNIEFERSLRSSAPLSLAMLDIDHFKVFNDKGGHAAGDDILCSIVDAIMRTLRPFDVCGRLGGDEFLILLPGCSAGDTATVCNRILGEVAAMPPHAAAGITPTVSIGYTEANPLDTVADILARADRALYVAKDRGRNCAQVELAPVPSASLELPIAPGSIRHSRIRRVASSMRDLHL